MDTNNLLTDIGLFVCVGGIVLLAVVALAVRVLTRSQTHTPNNTGSWNNRGPGQAHYNDPNIESQIGFGSVPNTGPTTPPQGGVIGSSGFGGAQTYNPDEGSSQSQNQPTDSDEIAS